MGSDRPQPECLPLDGFRRGKDRQWSSNIPKAVGFSLRSSWSWSVPPSGIRGGGTGGNIPTDLFLPVKQAAITGKDKKKGNQDTLNQALTCGWKRYQRMMMSMMMPMIAPTVFERMDRRLMIRPMMVKMTPTGQTHVQPLKQP